MNLLAQDRSERAAHGGRLSEHFQFDAGPGSQFFVSYALPRIPVSEELSVGLHVRSTRAGVQIFGRVVLPADVDPETKAPSYVLVPGTIFDQIDRWQRIELVQMLPTIERQARVLRASTRRPVRLDGAYLEKVVVNLMGGAGESEVFLDDLEIKPVPKDVLAGPSKPESSGKPATVPRSGDASPKDGSSGGRASAAGSEHPREAGRRPPFSRMDSHGDRCTGRLRPEAAPGGIGRLHRRSEF